MELRLEHPQDIRLVTAHGPGWVEIDRERHETNLILTPEAVAPWFAGGFDALDETAIDALFSSQPELVLISTGATLRRPPVPLLRHLAAAGIGFEFMTLSATCRTYNVTASEGRRVVAGLILT